MHSAIPGLLPTTGFAYRGFVHVSDWLPSLLELASGSKAAASPASLAQLDGHALLDAIRFNRTSPRTELLHNIDTFGGAGPHGFGNAAMRVGDLKLIVGTPGKGDHFVPPGCAPEVCVPPVPPAGRGCAPDAKDTSLWLFDLAADPYELCNLAAARPADVAALLARLQFYNDSAVPTLYPPDDPASNPANRSGVEQGSWGPWRPDEL